MAFKIHLISKQINNCRTDCSFSDTKLLERYAAREDNFFGREQRLRQWETWKDISHDHGTAHHTSETPPKSMFGTQELISGKAEFFPKVAVQRHLLP